MPALGGRGGARPRPQAHAPAADGFEPEESAHQPRAAGTEQPRNPEDLAAVERERRGGWTEVTHLEDGRAAAARRPWVECLDGPADHEANDVGRGELGGCSAARNLAVADDHDPVGDGLYFFDEVRDVDDGVAGASQLGDEREEPARVGLRQAARRFVEHEYSAADGEGAADFNQLLRGGGERGHRRVDRDLGMAQSRQDVGRGAPHVRAANQAETRRLHAEQDVLGHRQMRRERELLVDHRDARAAGVERMRGVVRLAVECHAAGVWLQRARQDGHQRALAGAILPDDRAHLPREDRYVYAVDGDGRSKRLPDPPHLEARCGHFAFSQRSRSGFKSAFASGVSMSARETTRTPVSIRRSTDWPLSRATTVLTPR